MVAICYLSDKSLSAEFYNTPNNEFQHFYLLSSGFAAINYMWNVDVDGSKFQRLPILNGD